ncbi:uroporphyrinogen-III synthase-like [Glandiceps talaboti]
MKVLLFRAPREGAEPDPYHKIFGNSGLEATSIPVLSFEFFGLDELYQEVQKPDRFSGVIFTSQRAVEAVDNCLKQHAEEGFRQQLMKSWSELPAYVVGTGTCSAAKQLGFTCKGEDSGTADKLSAVISKEIKPRSKPLLFPCGTLKRETLPVNLAENEIVLQTLEVYKTTAHPQLEEALEDYKRKQGIPDLCVFFSPSGVKFSRNVLRRIFPTMQEIIQFVAIGPTTKEALEKDGLQVFCTSPKPNPEALCSSILESTQT